MTIRNNDFDPATRAMMEKVAEEAACNAIKKTLTMLGIDHTDPVEFQKDTAHLRAWRKRVERIEEKSMTAGILAFLGLVAAAVIYGIRSKLGF